MKNYVITVNGNAYDVTVEEAGGDVSAPAAAAPKAAAPKKAAPAPKAAAGGTPINAPMRGTIVDVKVKVGDKVTNGTVVAVLEAMKMENEILAPAAGTVKKLYVQEGKAVQQGEALIDLE